LHYRSAHDDIDDDSGVSNLLCVLIPLLLFPAPILKQYSEIRMHRGIFYIESLKLKWLTFLVKHLFNFTAVVVW